MKMRTSKRFWLWLSAPLCLLLVAASGLGGLSSCMKSLEIEQPDVGEEVPMQTVVTSLDEALQEVSPNTIAVGQETYYEVNYKILGTPTVKKVLDQRLRVVAIQDAGDRVKVYVENTFIDYNQSPPTIIQKEKVDEFKKVPVDGKSVLQQGRDLKLVSASSLSGPSPRAQQEDEKKVLRYSYHNLTVRKNLVTDPPSDVSSKPGCGGLPNCSMRYTFIEFDEVEWFEDDTYKKTRYQLEISPDSTYYGYFISNCTIYPVSNYRIRACQVLRSFNK